MAWLAAGPWVGPAPPPAPPQPCAPFGGRCLVGWAVSVAPGWCLGCMGAANILAQAVACAGVRICHGQLNELTAHVVVGAVCGPPGRPRKQGSADARYLTAGAICICPPPGASSHSRKQAWEDRRPGMLTQNQGYSAAPLARAKQNWGRRPARNFLFGSVSPACWACSTSRGI
ncbi:unnamed protein product [Amoebophrya sp. A120]|nr:unnamed protein product [Amoebophrya sp. A120]|eukprot:GSA120T00013120001.1